jgi:hypothetical protein
MLAVTAGCASRTPTAPGGPLSVQVVLAPGDSIQIQGTAVRLRFQGVTDDSRCPGDALCIWGGDAQVRIDVVPSRTPPATYDLHTATQQPVRHQDLTIDLVELAPYPFSSRRIAPNDYRATFRITR